MIRTIASRAHTARTLLFFALAVLLAAGSAALPAPLRAQGAADPFAPAAGAADPFAAAGGGDPFAQAAGDAGGGGGFGSAGAAGPLFGGLVQMEMAHHVGPDEAQPRDLVLSNVRARLKTALTGEDTSAFLKVDFLADEVRETTRVDLREARVLWTPVRWLDVNAGVQVSTWGVGDMVFINDLFPKNWIANFTGQELEFLKEPANALRLTVYPGALSWDVVYTPRFAPDVVPTGCRFAVLDPNTLTLGGSTGACEADPSLPPEGSGASGDGEVATRIAFDVGAMQAALYGYRGFWKSPRGLMWIDPATGEPVTGPPTPGSDVLMPYHPRLEVFGLSLEGTLGPGILALEGGRYHSLDDPDGTDPLIENSVRKGLLGYRMDFSARFSAGVQWMVEVMEDYEAYRAALPAGSPLEPRTERRDTFTLRLMVKARQDTLFFHFFGYHRPDDQDGLYKLWLTQRVDDHLEVSTGANVFTGREGYEDREFGMLRNGDNAFVRFTYNY